MTARGLRAGADSSVPVPHGVAYPPTPADELGRGTKTSVKGKNVQAPFLLLEKGKETSKTVDDKIRFSNIYNASPEKVVNYLC